MSSETGHESGQPKGRWRKKLVLFFLGLHLLGLLIAALGYRFWLRPIETELRDRQIDVNALGIGMQFNYAIWESADRRGQRGDRQDKDFAHNFAANTFQDSMKEFSPRLTAYYQMSKEYSDAGKEFAVLYAIAAGTAIFGLIGCVALLLSGSWLQRATITALVGLCWGGACGMLFDCFPFSTISIYRTEPWGAVTGAGCSAIVGFLAGVVSAAFSRPADNQTILTSASS
jgi:hypothetical protein